VTRIARGSGHAINEVMALLEEHRRLAKMFQGTSAIQRCPPSERCTCLNPLDAPLGAPPPRKDVPGCAFTSNFSFADANLISCADTLLDLVAAGAMKGMKMPKGGGKGGRMPQMNMDPAQMVRQGFVRECSVVRRHLLGLQLVHAACAAALIHSWRKHTPQSSMDVTKVMSGACTPPPFCVGPLTLERLPCRRACCLPTCCSRCERDLIALMPLPTHCPKRGYAAVHRIFGHSPGSLAHFPFFFLVQAVTPRSADCRWEAWVRYSK